MAAALLVCPKCGAAAFAASLVRDKDDVENVYLSLSCPHKHAMEFVVDLAPEFEEVQS